MRLTVAICTWNRARLLARALERLTTVEPPAMPWEVLVVDNGSSDDTPRVLDHFARRLPLRRVVEAALGLSNARNAAVARQSGDYIVWTDDDVLVDQGWLRAYERAILRWPEAAVFGGPVRVQLEGPPPGWLKAVWASVAEAFAARDFGEMPLPLEPERRIPYGANYGIRVREQRLFPYDPARGRCGAAGSLGEETAVIRAVLERGGTGWWVPDAAVSHWVPRERQTVDYLRRYFALSGVTATPSGSAPASRSGLIRRYLRAECSYRFRRLMGDPRRWIEPLIEASRIRGQLVRVRGSR